MEVLPFTLTSMTSVFQLASQWWFAWQPRSKKVWGSNPAQTRGPFCVELICSPSIWKSVSITVFRNISEMSIKQKLRYLRGFWYYGVSITSISRGHEKAPCVDFHPLWFTATVQTACLGLLETKVPLGASCVRVSGVCTWRPVHFFPTFDLCVLDIGSSRPLQHH